MMAMRVAIDRASSWSWVTNTNVVPTWRWIRDSSVCMCLRSLRSSAPSGSSRRSTAGRLARARARATRCCWPPDISDGKPPVEAGQTDELEVLTRPAGDLGRRQLLHPQAERDVLGDGHVREQGVVLEDGVDVALVGRQVVDRPALDAQLARGHRDEPADEVEGRRLAAAGRSEQAEELARLDDHRHVVEGDRVTVAFGHVAQARWRASSQASRAHAEARGPRPPEQRARSRRVEVGRQRCGGGWSDTGIKHPLVQPFVRC